MALDSTPRVEPEYYSTSVNERCGVMIIKEDARLLLWVTFRDQFQFYPCSNLTQLLEILQRQDIMSEFAGEWESEEGVAEGFADMWRMLLADVREQCSQWKSEPQELVPDRVKRQLLWAFDSTGKLDGERFTTILKYERVHLTPSQLAELASELTARPRIYDNFNPN